MSTLKQIGVLAMLLMSAITSILDIHAQPINYFKNLTVEEGLSDNTVKSVIEDEQGFIWIGTFNGLCKYDGNSIKIFRHINGDNKSIIDNHVEALLNVKNGILVGTCQGLNFYDTRTGYFRQALMSTSGKPVSSNIKDLIQIDNKIFALTYSKGLLEMMPDSTFQPTSLYIGEVSGLTECRGNLLMSTRNGLEWIDVKSGRVMGSISIPYKETNDKCIYYDDKENIVYVGNGIGFGTEAYRISSEGVFKKINKGLPRNVKAIVRLGEKMVFATDGEGIIMQSDSAEKSITRFNSSLPVDAVHSLYVDRDSNMWIGTYRGGLNLYSKRYSWFQSLSVPEFLKANAVTAIQPFGKDLYIGLDGGGVWRYNHDGNSAVYTSQNSGLPVDNVLEILSDGDCLWLGVYNGGLVKFNPRSNKFDTYKIPSSSYEEDNNHIWDIADDGHGNIYVLCEDLYIFNKSEKNFQLFSQLNRKYPTGITFDKDTAWISTTNAGLFKIDTKARRILKHYTQKGFMNIRYIYKDKTGFLWLSSENNGIIRFNSSTRKYKSFKPVNGSPNGNVTSIAEDKAGNLWMATTNGLFVYDIADNKFLRFGKEDNIPYSQFNYHSCLNQDSVLYFGAIGGIVRFEPQIMNLKSRKKGLYFLNLRLLDSNHTEFQLNSSSPSKIELSHNENFFTVSFSVPEPVTSDKLSFYAYLEGFDKEWQNLGKLREVSYTNVPPGEYVLHVKTSDSYLSSEYLESTMPLVITQPWWKRWWATILWIFIGISLICLLFYAYRRELNIQHRVAMNEMERNATRTISEAKLNFYTNVTHELRTPIFLLTANLEEIIKGGDKSLYMPKSYVTTMYKNALRLNKIVSRIIDFRKLESGKLKLNLYRQDVVSFCRKLTEDYEALCSQKDILFYFHPSKTTIIMDFDAEKLETIISNLISNAFKYTQEGGRITFSINERDSEVEFSVSDNGIGIKKEYHEAIFNKFFQIDPTKSPTMSDGIGLSYVRHLVELHGGSITVESVPDKGATFTFLLPFVKDGEESGDGTSSNEQPAIEMQESTVTPLQQPLVPQVFVSSPAATKTILVIDDEPETLELLERSLIGEFRIIKAKDGMEGVTLAQKEIPDLIICDIMMPKLDGIGFLKIIKEDKKLQGVPVIMFTAKISDESQVEAFEAGADAYLTKPISIALLKKRIDNLIKKSESVTLVGEISNIKKKYSKEDQNFILRCRDVIEDNLTNDSFNVDLLATSLGMSHSTLYRRIKDVTEMSVVEFINDYRIFRAVRFFREGERNVTVVSVKCGFNDLKNFRELFKRKTGMTPRQFIGQL